ncbi:hypothetical protein SETIT_8G242600v2 [Setaria italica]|uniref:Uncharacterized protein n=1 Tax=Setaria italica TaxID=4555 RepID=K3ZGX6_SETIT|nr:putative disease resistance protein RGA4 [Setaria italica]RCV39672.1 hypothetical protein SETIT_8G242600v2 [Setaria italica]
MAGLAVSLVVGPLVSLVKEKASNYLLDKYKVMEGMEKQHEVLKRKLPAILDVIADAEKQASHQKGVKVWLGRLKTVAYQAIDIFDEFEYEALRRQAKKNGHITKLGKAGVKLFPTHNRVIFRIRMASKLQRVVGAIKVLVDQMNDFGFNRLQHQQAPALKEGRETDSNIVDPKNIVSRSRHEERKKIVEILVNDQATNGDLKVLPIVGMGGLGKTTLAQLIYNDPQVKDHFQLLKWVCVSDDFNLCNLANKICNASEGSLEKALKELQEQLKGKRYLLVLDDVWDEESFLDKWEKFKACLEQGGVGSAVLTTTRNTEIAQLMGTVGISHERKYLDVGNLGKEFIQEIIETRAFSLHKRDDELVNLVGPIAERCAGSPLAAKALGSILRKKTTTEEWEDVLQRSNICTVETGILPILKLSYDELPTDMKPCFAFCALYPKDYQIDVDNLIQLWMANGFIVFEQNKVPIETVGKRIVNEMVSRSLFEHVEQDPTKFGYSSTTFLKIHDLMHDVAVSATEDEYIYVTDEMDESGKLLPSATRHIHFETWEGQLFANIDILSIRTLLVVPGRYYRDELHSSKYSSLRALALPASYYKYLPMKPKNLHHLRYLDISKSTIKALPDDISILYNLQTLKLSGCEELSMLPKQMKYMTALCHLYTDGCTKLQCMPPELGRLTSLRTLTCFVVSSDSDCSSLGELKNLNIGGSLELKQLENVTEARNARQANLGNKKELRQLSLRWTSGKGEEQQCNEVLEVLEVHDRLLALEIEAYQGTNFPLWMGALRNMVELRLSDCSKSEQLPPLCQLPALQLLHLEGLTQLQFLCSSCTSSTFGKLKDLKLDYLPNFDRFYDQVVQEELVAFPQLEKLHIEGCRELTALPEAGVLRKWYDGGEYTMVRSAFPELKSLVLIDLWSFERWEAAIEIEVEHALFPLLETVRIYRCDKLTTLPRAPKLRELCLSMNYYKNQQRSLGATRYMTSLSNLKLERVEVDGKDKWDYISSVTNMHLDSCSLFFQSHALALWACFRQLQDLVIRRANDLIYWPENEFQNLVSLRRLYIGDCESLVGYAPDQATLERSQLLPCLESLSISFCDSLVEVFNPTPALKEMDVEYCKNLKTISFKQQDKTSLNAGHPSTDVIMASTAVQDLSPSAGRSNFLPSSLETLTIDECDGLLEVLNLPSSLKEIYISGCSQLQILSGELDALSYLSDDCPAIKDLRERYGIHF